MSSHTPNFFLNVLFKILNFFSRLEAVAKEVLNAVRDHEKITPSSWDNLRQRFAHLTKDPSTKAFLLGQQQIDAAA